MNLDFLPGLKTALGGVVLLLSVVAPGLFTQEETENLVEAIMQIAGGALVVYGLGMKLWRWHKER